LTRKKTTLPPPPPTTTNDNNHNNDKLAWIGVFRITATVHLHGQKFMDKIRPSHDFFKIGVPDGTATRVDNVFRQQVRRHMPFRTHGNFIQGGVGGDGGLTRQRSLFYFVVFVGA
jgi:hypothetical protein